jgi:thiamine transport system substrate-binding protein
VVNSWSDAYFVEFTKGGADGNYPIVLSYASSPAAEWVYANEPKPKTVGTTSMMDGCFRQIEYAGILRGTDNRAGAEKVIDWLLSKEVQEDIPFNMFVYPVSSEAGIDPKFVEFAPFASNPITLDVEYIAENLDTWLAEWDSVMRN